MRMGPLSRAASSALLDRVQEFHPQDFQWVVDMMQKCLSKEKRKGSKGQNVNGSKGHEGE